MKPTRIVHETDALAWLESASLPEGSSIVASLPDFTEFPNLSVEEWKAWWHRVARLALERCPREGVVIFYQRDSKLEGEWISKAYLCLKAAEECGAALLWHKIVARVPRQQVAFGKPGYSHLLCFSRGLRLELSAASADILESAGERTWARGMGEEVCETICRFLLKNTKTHTVVHPFCGEGGMLAAANSFGLHAVGIELSRKRAEKARDMVFPFPRIHA